MGTSGLEVHRDTVEAVVAVAQSRVSPAQRPLVAELARRYLAHAAPEDLSGRSAESLAGVALAHWRLGARRERGVPRLAVGNPTVEVEGWTSAHTVVDIVTDDMPFLVESVTIALRRMGYGVHAVVHPLLDVQRAADGTVVALLDGPPNEAWMHLEIDRASSPERREALAAELRAVLAQVRAVVEDWPAMRGRAAELADTLEHTPPPVAAAEVAETVELLRWLAEDHFTFLGFRRYDLAGPADAVVLRGVAGTGLGLLRDDQRAPVEHALADLIPEARGKALDDDLLIVTRARGRSPVHRGDHLAVVGVKRFDESGRPCGEDRFVGLYTALAYRVSASAIPFLEAKITAVLDRAGLPRDSHSGRQLWNILETFPREDLFQIETGELFDLAIGILNLQERRQVRLFARRDPRGQFVSCLVFVPRDRYSSRVVEKVEAVLLDAYGGLAAEHETRISESVLARVHVLLQVGRDGPREVDVAAVERRLSEVARWWSDDLRVALVDRLGDEVGRVLHERYVDAFPAAYREALNAAEGAHDVERVEQLTAGGGMAAVLRHPPELAEGEWRFSLYTTGAVTLSSALPLLEHLGAEVVDERPFEIRPAGAPAAWRNDIGLRFGPGARVDDQRVREQLVATFSAQWRGEAESDGFDRLVAAAGLSHREVTVVRAYARYLRQIGATFSQAYLEDALVRHADVTRRLVDLFVARLDPRHDGPSTLEVAAIAGEVLAALDAVASLDDDRILRSFLALVQATQRTNAFRPADDGGHRPVLVIKLDPAQVPDLPLPRPMFELWVYSPHVEGVHLRGGKVARGGLRWSDRREDFRTEVLGLMKAQMVKNAVIVPVGAKGGFVVKRPPAEPEALRAEVVRCYRDFVGGLLDVTDDVVDGVVVPPPDVVCHDGDDPYLVVAADKGTATFSDIANAIAVERGFWLGDAFASGGSAGYDHKTMAITARGAWESVRRHFRTLGTDADHSRIDVVGIGDMSGDVFGNGMLLSSHLRLVAAFDHRHVFLDPDPDPATSFAERARLFALPRSSWDDYDRSLLSKGGAIHPRSAKSIPLSAETRAVLGAASDVLTPNELISAILRAPVDLLWNGGIGTYVKASTETNADVGDRANDGLRVDAADLRCRVVGEGGNLGFTQRARVEAARHGVLVNTDAIDNSAGVDCSDHEVNIKIALGPVVARGECTTQERDALLAEMTDDVAALVLHDNVAQNIALTIARSQSSEMIDVHARYLRSLEREGLIDRELEALPTEKQLAERQAAGLGLTTPDFAVILAYTKTTDVAEVLASDLPEDPYLAADLLGYFPPAMQRRFGDVLPAHRLHREIIATCVVNEMVNRAGTSFDFRMTEESGSSVPDVVRAHLAARDIVDLREGWDDITALDGIIDGAVQVELWMALRRLAERSVQWLLRRRRPPLDIGATVAGFKPGADLLAERLPAIVTGSFAAEVAGQSARLNGLGVPAALAVRAASWPLLHTSFDIVEVARARGRAPEDAGATYWRLIERLELAWLWDRIGVLPRNDRWQTHARAAMRDDLLAALRELTDEVLRAGDLFSGPDDLVERWLRRNRRPTERAAAVFEDIRSAGTYDVTTLSVALRQLRNLVLASSPGV